MTAAIGLLAIGRFNLISVAFIPLFVGLGVDFSIQFSVRSLAERLIHPNLRAALIATGTAIGRALALSAAAIGAGFFAFLPTSYVGVAELGTIAGLGMIVAFTLSVVLLPALLMLLRPPAGRLAEVGFTMLAPVDDLRASAPPAGARGRACRGDRLGRAAAAGAFRLRPAEPQEFQSGIDGDPAGARRPIPTGRPMRSTFLRRPWSPPSHLCTASMPCRPSPAPSP